MEIEIQAPQAVQHYRAGQFFRLESTWLFASNVDHQNKTLTFSMTKETAKIHFLNHFNIGDNIALMGPTGVRSKISEFHENVLIIGNQKSVFHVKTYAKALKEQKNHIVLLMYLKPKEKFFYQQEIEALCDRVIIAEDCISALKAYAESKHEIIPLTEIDRIQVIGESSVLKEIVQLQKTYLKDKLPKSPNTTASAYGPMQCMLKGVCAQCLQWQIDPETGERTKAVFACSWQDQPIEIIDLAHLASREKQNACQETLNYLLMLHNKLD